jgi:hypothetical protein
LAWKGLATPIEALLDAPAEGVVATLRLKALDASEVRMKPCEGKSRAAVPVVAGRTRFFHTCRDGSPVPEVNATLISGIDLRT